jgi:hypothetical protein
MTQRARGRLQGPSRQFDSPAKAIYVHHNLNQRKRLAEKVSAKRGPLLQEKSVPHDLHTTLQVADQHLVVAIKEQITPEKLVVEEQRIPTNHNRSRRSTSNAAETPRFFKLDSER